MLRFALRRLLVALLVALAVSAASFLLVFLAGDPAVAMLGQGGRAEDAAALRTLYGFDRPLPIQYAAWLAKALVGDFGRSQFFNLPVAAILWERLPTTMTLGVCGLAFALALSLPLGILAALRPNSALDRIALLVAVTGQAIPSFWLGLMLIVLLGVVFPVLPISGADDWRGFVLPTVVLGYYATPGFMRLTRAGMIDVLEADFIRTARAKGLSAPDVVLRHALPNAIIPVVSLAAVQFGFMLSGSIVIESVFALNGVGRLAWESITRSDLPVVQAIVLVFAVIYVILTLAADLLNAWLDPRIRAA
ncbi:MAG: ABC transporter permease [Alphaproteobacteria bacterium]|nr:ABC transporter permease [Alphaproteobacteria bacterium]